MTAMATSRKIRSDESTGQNRDKSDMYDVIIIGAGLAGLQAARTLLGLDKDEADVAGNDSMRPARRPRVVVVEASGSVGGRVCSVEGFAPWPLELGAEFIHGDRGSSMKALLDAMGCQQKELPYPDRIFFGDTQQLLSPAEVESDAEVASVYSLFNSLRNKQFSPHPDADMAVADWMKSKGATRRQLAIADAIYANDFGCSLQQLGLDESIVEAQQWTFGDSYFILLDRSCQAVVTRMAESIEVRCNWQVSSVSYSASAGVRVNSNGGQVLLAKAAIVTVPLEVLRLQRINFMPPLPPAKLDALSRIRMGNAIKVFLFFSCAFWPADLFDVVCTDSFLPEIWTTPKPQRDMPHSPAPPPSSSSSSHLAKHVIVGFAAGSAADKISQMDPKEVVLASIAQLNAIFGKTPFSRTTGNAPTVRCKARAPSTLSSSLPSSGDLKVTCLSPMQVMILREDSNERSSLLDEVTYPASHYFTAALICDWSKNPFALGAYTHPSIGARGSRKELARAVDGVLFFAGEATHEGVNPCMQGALDSGKRAAWELRMKSVSSKM